MYEDESDILISWTRICQS